MDAAFIAIEIGGTKIQVVGGDAKGKIVLRRRSVVNPAEGAHGIRKQVESFCSELHRMGRFQAVGVGFGGPVERRTGRVIKSHQVLGWDGFPLGEWLSQVNQLPVWVENDANAAALAEAEAEAGAGKGCNSVFYITLGSGVGGGFVQGGKVFHGAEPTEMEIGHLRLDHNGRTVEQFCSGWAVDRRLREAAKAHPDSLLSKRIGARVGGESLRLGEALEAGDALAAQVLSEWAQDFALGLSHVVHLVHPEIIVLGGGLSLVGEPIVSAVGQELGKQLMEVMRPGPALSLAKLGEDAVPVGALLLAARECESAGSGF